MRTREPTSKPPSLPKVYRHSCLGCLFWPGVSISWSLGDSVSLPFSDAVYLAFEPRMLSRLTP